MTHEACGESRWLALAFLVVLPGACRGTPAPGPKVAEAGEDAVGLGSERAAFTIDGPFADGEPVAVLAEEKSLVDGPVSVTMSRRPRGGAQIEVRFLYAGEPGSYGLAVKLTARDAQGEILLKGEERTIDQRLLNLSVPVTDVSVRRDLSPTTVARFVPADEILERTARVDLEFRRYRDARP